MKFQLSDAFILFFYKRRGFWLLANNEPLNNEEEAETVRSSNKDLTCLLKGMLIVLNPLDSYYA